MWILHQLTWQASTFTSICGMMNRKPYLLPFIYLTITWLHISMVLCLLPLRIIAQAALAVNSVTMLRRPATRHVTFRSSSRDQFMQYTFIHHSLQWFLLITPVMVCWLTPNLNSCLFDDSRQKNCSCLVGSFLILTVAQSSVEGRI